MDQATFNQITGTMTSLGDVLYKALFALFIGMFIKDIVSDFVSNLWIYIKMRWNSKSYSSEGGEVEINGEDYIIIGLEFPYVHLRRKGNCKKIRMTLKHYWSNNIVYTDNVDK